MITKDSIIINSTSIPIDIGTMAFSLLSEFNLLFFLISSVVLIFIPLMTIRNKFKYSVSLEKKTYEWYKEKYPSSVQGNIITCYTCENNLIDVRALNHEVFQKEIYCTECGRTLYYLS
jgi:hypothetical protein